LIEGTFYTWLAAGDDGRELVGIARERVKAPRDAFNAVDEQAEMDARPRTGER
jgi:hypothetical protein